MSPATYDPKFKAKQIRWDIVDGDVLEYDLGDGDSYVDRGSYNSDGGYYYGSSSYRYGSSYSYNNDDERWDTGEIFAFGLFYPYARFLEAAIEEGELSGERSYVSVVTHPCMQNAGNASDPGTCAAVCTDRGELFSNWRTLLSCLTLASASLAFHRLDWKNDTRRVTTDDILGSISGEGVNLTKLDGAAILDTAYQCAAASCLQNSMGKCNETVESAAKKFFDKDSDDWSFLDASYCSSVQGSINVDVAGPGVSLSPPERPFASTHS